MIRDNGDSTEGYLTGISQDSELYSYFQKSGISKSILTEYSDSFGDAYRNNTFSILQGNDDEVIVFHDIVDTLSFLQLLKLNEQKNNRTLITLNATYNVDDLITNYQNFGGKMFLCLDGSESGNVLTGRIKSALNISTIKDIRILYNVSQGENENLNDYLQHKLQIKRINSTLVKPNGSINESTTQSETVSNSQPMEQPSAGQEIGRIGISIKSKQEDDIGGGQNVGGHNVGNGFTKSSSTNRGRTGSRNKSDDSFKQNQTGTFQGYTLERGLKESTNIPELDLLIDEAKGQRLTNEDILKIVSAATFVSVEHKIELKADLKITENLRNLTTHFQSGGLSKHGRGILDGYYTDQDIVIAIQNLLRNQFKLNSPISVLEPSVGTGNFLSLTRSLPVGSNVTAFEINEVSGRIAKILYPETAINLRSFETEFISETGHKIPADHFKKYDLVIGNPPYGEHRGFYKGLGEETKITKYEDYFVKRSIDSLKEKGILAMVLPSGWIRRQNQLENIEMVHAFRLPVGVFSGTQVGTDIIVLKKDTGRSDQDFSNFFDENPGFILGEVRERSNRFGKMEKYVYGNLEDAIAKIQRLQIKNNNVRIGNLFEDFIADNNDIDLALKSNQVQISQNKRNSTDLFDEETKDSLVNECHNKVSEVLSQLNRIKFKSFTITSEIAFYEKLSENLKTRPENYLEEDLSEIIEKCDRIISIHQTKNDFTYMRQFQPQLKKGVLKYHFIKDDAVVSASLQNSSELSEESIEAFKDSSYNGSLYNHEKHLKFANYQDGEWIHDFYYAEGNIYSKLEQLEKDFSDKKTSAKNINQYEKQKALLEQVLPQPKSLDEIFISPNHEFVHKFHLGFVEKEQYNHERKSTEIVSVPYHLADQFKDFISKLSNEAFSGSSAWEVKGFVDNESVTGSDKERNALVRERRKAAANDLFQKFIREELNDDIRERFVKDFNRNYNNIHVPEYSKFPLFSKINLNFKGVPLRLSDVQKAGIGRQTTKGVGLLAHEVGFGKTLSGIISLHEAMQRANAKRPLIVVPNESILRQWVESIFETIPNAKLNVLGNLGKDYDLSKFIINDGEITIVTYEGFNNIGFSNDITERLASKFSYISESEVRGVVNTERENQLSLQKEKENEGKMKRGKIYDWEDFGFDHLTYDEVHNANHIVGKVKIEDRRFSSDFRSQNQQTSKLGINTWMAAQYIQEKNNGRNVTLLSATPFTNKPLEYYSILSLIANKRLEESGYFNVNTFFETFMEADNDMEIDAKGDVKFKANVRRFKNNSLFQQLLSEFIDVKGEEDNLQLIRPNKINKEYKIEQNDLVKEQYALLNDNFCESEKGAILTHILNARLIAVSPYLSVYYNEAEPSAKQFINDSPKLNETMKLIRQNKSDLPKAGQIIYSELAVAMFPKLQEYLITEMGYSSDEVGIITGETSKKNRISIQDDFNSGKIKVVIGSEAIQEGMNLQENTTDIYMLTLPYNFTSLRQIEGRAWRQGNKNENIRINFMLMNDSIDVFMLQKLQSKQARYLEAMKNGADVLDISDISTQELKTSIITNPETRANIEIEMLKKRYEAERNKFLADNAFVLRKYESFLRVKEMVTTAELSYNRILGYAHTNDENAEYWLSQLPSYQKTVDLAKDEVKKVIENLETKGVNVLEIEKQTRLTEENITQLDLKIEKLPALKDVLINQYSDEKEKQKQQLQAVDYVNDRKGENAFLFGTFENNQAVYSRITHNESTILKIENRNPEVQRVSKSR